MAMAATFSMAALQAALPSVGISRNVKLQSLRTAPNASSLVVRSQGLKNLSYSGLQRENPLSLAAETASEGITSLVSNGSRWFAMRHGKRVPRLGRPADQRKALVRGLTTEVLRHGKIKTTQARAKAIRKWVDHMITLAKGGSLHHRRQALGFIYDEQVVKNMFDEAPKSYGTREGGYTKITRTMPRRGDNAPMAYIELVEVDGGDDAE